MHIIFLFHHHSKPVSVTISRLLTAAIGTAALLFVIGLSLGFTLKKTTVLWQESTSQVELDSLAIKLGEVQATLMRIDDLARQMGIKTEITAKRAHHRTTEQIVPTAAQISSWLNHAHYGASHYLDQFTATASLAAHEQSSSPLPTYAPLIGGFRSSNFGWRINPLSGKRAFHAGVDWASPSGTPVRAIADGKVIYAGYHAQYGNMIDLDHGHGLTSRYAHAKKLIVKKGDNIQAGQKIAETGTTGHSTGPHLHFEIHYKGVAQHPLRFIPDRSKMAAR